MKLGRFEIDGIRQVGVFTNCEVLPITALMPGHKTMMDCLSLDVETLSQAITSYKGQRYGLNQVRLLAPFEKPVRNLFCMGKNYTDHALEMQGKTTDAVVIPKTPIYFSKACHSFLPPEGEITGHVGLSDQVDYEVELAVIIGKPGRDIEKSQVRNHIFGYTIANDVSARDLQVAHIQWHRGKSLDGFCPLGPVVLLRDSIAFPPTLTIECLVNGEIRQHSKTDRLIFDIETIISELSRGMTLEAGDIILTGTPSGVGMGFDPPRYLQAGDEIICRIEGIGELRNYLK